MASISQTYLRSSTEKASLKPPRQNPAATRGSPSAANVSAAMTSSRSVALARSTCGFLKNLTGARTTALRRFASMASPRGRNSMARLAAPTSPAPISTRNRPHASREPSCADLWIARARVKQPSGSSRGALQKVLKSPSTDASSRFQRASSM